MTALPAAPRRGSGGATSVSAPRRRARRIRVARAVPSTYTQVRSRRTQTFLRPARLAISLTISPRVPVALVVVCARAERLQLRVRLQSARAREQGHRHVQHGVLVVGSHGGKRRFRGGGAPKVRTPRFPLDLATSARDAHTTLSPTHTPRPTTPGTSRRKGTTRAPTASRGTLDPSPSRP